MHFSVRGNNNLATAVKVNIYNQSYNLRASGDDAYVKQIAEYVDERMQEISAQTNVLDYGKIARPRRPQYRR